MKSRIIFSISLPLLYLFMSCTQQNNNAQSTVEDGWQKESQVLKSINNIHFSFPDSGYAFDHRYNFVDECFEAMQSDGKLIGLEQFKDTIYVRFLKSRNDMKMHTGMAASGIAHPHIKTLFVVADSTEKIKPPIKHEMMHLIAMLEWGYPHYTSTWINEGIAAFAEDNCNGYSVSEIYRYFLETGKLIAVDSLVTDFYRQSEMIGYHQSAYVVEYLLKNYSTTQFKRLWKEGFYNFESIYGTSFVEVKKNLEEDLIKLHPEVPNINWDTFKEGCMK